jgi:hypothetical protein
VSGIFTPEQYSRILASAPEKVDKATASALKSEGWRIREVIKQSVEAGGHAGDKWEALNPHTAIFNKARKAARKGKRIRRKKARVTTTSMRLTQELSGGGKALQRLASGATYQYHAGAQTVTVGFISAKVMSLMKKAAAGFKTVVTPRMRRMAFAIGFPLRKGTTTLVTPPRSVVPQVFKAERPKMVSNVRDKVAAKIIGHMVGKAK